MLGFGTKSQHEGGMGVKGIGKRIGAVLCTMPMVLAMTEHMAVQAAPAGVTVLKKQIPVYRKSLSEQETVECTFFSDLPNVPYMPLEVFYDTFMDGDMNVSRDGTRYTYTDRQYGSVAVADAERDTLTSADMANFVATPVYKQKDGLVMGGPDKMVKVQKVEYDRPSAALTFELGRYGIDLREEDGILYFPFATASDLFSNIDVLTAYYADETIYFDAEYQEINGGHARSQKGDYLPWLLENERPADMIDFNYHELCFSVENFYGYPCSYSDFADKMQQTGLDAALTAFDPTTKQLLLSVKPAEYVAGLYRLFNLWLADGGHTGADFSTIFSNSDYAAAVAPVFNQYNSADSIGDNYYVDKNNQMIQTMNTLMSQRQSTLGKGEYHSQGDTALITFNSFEVDYEGWDNYFGGQSTQMPDDTVGLVYRCLQKAEQDTAVKNVVFDLSTNGGGDTIALEAVVGMVRGTFDCHFYNVLGQQTLTQTTVTDRNLDGTINAQDMAVRYGDLNFAVLSSSYSFSCANIMTALMKEGGCPIIGETSGGGACAVLLRATADGLSYRLSSYARFVTPALATTDDGIPADVALVTAAADGTKDYSRFYDLTAISQAVNRYYKEQESSHVSAADNSQLSSAVSTEEPSEVSATSAVQSVQTAQQPSQTSMDQPSSAPSGIPSSGAPSRTVTEPSAAGSVPDTNRFSAPQTVGTSSQGTMVLVLILFGVMTAAVIAAAVVVLVKHK